MNGRRILVAFTAAVVAGLMAACGGGGSSPTAPSGGGGTPTSGATITITSAGVNPASVTISVGQAVTFVNNDSKSHTMDSDPHPAHTDCPALNAGTIAAGATKMTDAFTAARTCSYHDHSDPGNAAWKGQVTVR